VSCISDTDTMIGCGLSRYSFTLIVQGFSHFVHCIKRLGITDDVLEPGRRCHD